MDDNDLTDLGPNLDFYIGSFCALECGCPFDAPGRWTAGDPVGCFDHGDVRVADSLVLLMVEPSYL